VLTVEDIPAALETFKDVKGPEDASKVLEGLSSLPEPALEKLRGISGRDLVNSLEKLEDYGLTDLHPGLKDLEGIANWGDLSGQKSLSVPEAFRQPYHGSGVPADILDRVGGMSALQNTVRQHLLNRSLGDTLDDYQKLKRISNYLPRKGIANISFPRGIQKPMDARLNLMDEISPVDLYISNLMNPSSPVATNLALRPGIPGMELKATGGLGALPTDLGLTYNKGNLNVAAKRKQLADTLGFTYGGMPMNTTLVGGVGQGEGVTPYHMSMTSSPTNAARLTGSYRAPTGGGEAQWNVGGQYAFPTSEGGNLTARVGTSSAKNPNVGLSYGLPQGTLDINKSLAGGDFSVGGRLSEDKWKLPLSFDVGTRNDQPYWNLGAKKRFLF
jgi:hypothetical protein